MELGWGLHVGLSGFKSQRRDFSGSPVVKVHASTPAAFRPWLVNEELMAAKQHSQKKASRCLLLSPRGPAVLKQGLLFLLFQPLH